ncbi:MAG TPA: O-antigen ligase family protein [Candidatus Levybacteria bacterium]|nr:O-antigen ligase family protein [Candidatus Levybacteria bacterium]
MGLLKILFLGIFVTFPLGVLIRISVAPQAYIYPVDFFVVLFVLYGVYALMLTQKNVQWFGSWKFFLVASFVSLLVNIYWLEQRELLVSSLYLVRLTMYLLLIPIVSSLFSKKDVSWILSVIALSIGVIVVGGLAQYFLYPDLRNLMYLGWDEHLYRVFSSFLDPNFASVIFVILFWIVVILTQQKKQKDFLSYVWYVLVVLTSIAILLTYSRTGYVAWVGSILVFVMITRKIKFFLILIACMLLGIVFLPKNLQSEGVNLFRTASVFSRIESYQTAFSIVQKNPVFGVGFNTYRYAQEKNISQQNSISRSHAGAGVSNSYLFVLATTGIVGFCAFLYVCWQTAKQILSIQSSSIRTGTISIGVAILLSGLTENTIFYSFILIVICCLLGVVRLATEKNGR